MVSRNEEDLLDLECVKHIRHSITLQNENEPYDYCGSNGIRNLPGDRKRANTQKSGCPHAPAAGRPRSGARYFRHVPAGAATPMQTSITLPYLELLKPATGRWWPTYGPKLNSTSVRAHRARQARSAPQIVVEVATWGRCTCSLQQAASTESCARCRALQLTAQLTRTAASSGGATRSRRSQSIAAMVGSRANRSCALQGGGRSRKGSDRTRPRRRPRSGAGSFGLTTPVQIPPISISTHIPYLGQ